MSEQDRIDHAKRIRAETVRRRKLQAIARKFKRDLERDGMKFQGATVKSGVPTITIRIGGERSDA